MQFQDVPQETKTQVIVVMSWIVVVAIGDAEVIVIIVVPRAPTNHLSFDTGLALDF